MPEKLYTKMQAAEYLQCSLSTINRRIKTGDLNPLKNGRIVRFTESELDRFIHDSNQNNNNEPIKEESAVKLPPVFAQKSSISLEQVLKENQQRKE